MICEYMDKELSFTDCMILPSLMEKFGLKNVFGFDSDFERLGHTVL